MKISDEYLLDLFDKYKGYFDDTCRKLIVDVANKNFKTTVSPIDALVMYFLIIDQSPKSVIEFSCYKGYSTCWIAHAMQTLGNKNFATFEMVKHNHEKNLCDNLTKYRLSDYVNVIWGNAFKTIPKFLSENKWKPQFCFVDFEHSKKAANKYTREIFPLLDENATICFHDITAKQIGQYGNFETNVKGRIRNEYEGVQNWVNKKKIKYSLLHALLGGKFQRSKDLPINEDFYKKAGEVLNFDLRSHIYSATILMIAKNEI